jgi:hypothetical protein
VFAERSDTTALKTTVFAKDLTAIATMKLRACDAEWLCASNAQLCNFFRNELRTNNRAFASTTFYVSQ